MGHCAIRNAGRASSDQGSHACGSRLAPLEQAGAEAQQQAAEGGPRVGAQRGAHAGEPGHACAQPWEGEPRGQQWSSAGAGCAGQAACGAHTQQCAGSFRSRAELLAAPPTHPPTPASKSAQPSPGRTTHPQPRAHAPPPRCAAQWRRCGCPPAPPAAWPGGRPRPGRAPPAQQGGTARGGGGAEGEREGGQAVCSQRPRHTKSASRVLCSAASAACSPSPAPSHTTRAPPPSSPTQRTCDMGTTARRAPRSSWDASAPSHSCGTQG